MSWPIRLAEQSVDSIFRWIPRAPLSLEEWKILRLVAHRGCVREDCSVYENTLPAFAAAQRCGAWGIELDVQWTLDDWPVVIHDRHTARLPGKNAVEVGATEISELRKLCPLVPRLEEVVEQFGGQMHLMIELKGAIPNARASTRLADCLAAWQPGIDFHLMSLEPVPLRAIADVPESAKLLIATTNMRAMFKEFKQGGFGGLTGHFLLLNHSMRAHLEVLGAPWGTGFVNSTNLLAREVRSGTKWIFSDAVEALMLNRKTVKG